MKNKLSSNILEIAKEMLNKDEKDRQEILPGFFLVREGLETEADHKILGYDLVGKNGDKFVVCMSGIF